jgi:hypothetical protein
VLLDANILRNLIDIKGKIMTGQVGDTVIQHQHKASGHCGAVELLLTLPNGLVDPHRCDCSICRRKAAAVATVPLQNLKLVKGEDVLTLYQFDSKEAKHYFCSVCGIYTHHQRRSNPNEYSINIGCLEGGQPDTTNRSSGLRWHQSS